MSITYIDLSTFTRDPLAFVTKSRVNLFDVMTMIDTLRSLPTSRSTTFPTNAIMFADDAPDLAIHSNLADVINALETIRNANQHIIDRDDARAMMTTFIHRNAPSISAYANDTTNRYSHPPHLDALCQLSSLCDDLR
jgi:hypothetical protein